MVPFQRKSRKAGQSHVAGERERELASQKKQVEKKKFGKSKQHILSYIGAYMSKSVVLCSIWRVQEKELNDLHRTLAKDMDEKGRRRRPYKDEHKLIMVDEDSVWNRTGKERVPCTGLNVGRLSTSVRKCPRIRFHNNQIFTYLCARILL